MSFTRLMRRVLCGSALLVTGIGAFAQANITRIVVPFNAGGATDGYVRLIAEEMTKRGIHTFVENKPGASGMIAGDAVARSKPDGLTLFMGSNSTLANNVVLFQKMPYDPAKDFAPVSHIGYQPSILIARASAPFSTLKDYVAYAKANPGKVNRASVGAGNITNLAGVMLDKAAGIQTTHIPYTGDPLAIQALLGDQVDVYVGSLTIVLPHVKAGKLRVLGVFDDQRLEQLPDVPTLQEAGHPLNAYAWYCLMAPAGTPPATVEKLNKTVNEILQDKDFAARASQLGVVRRGGTPQDLAKFIQSEYDKWAPVITGLGLAKTM
ncbi:tripartite tricarboxylate transporter substrate binding protein [Piscinibacter sp. XHJ-5]|uniref:Bug family tripartite tricarboxylate transporter substrate binding protein n=1 Tax=Piscinibacter sp. XHJ-5 TaxID=3037797 RepID=UPI002452ED67|nr:tripartite tricarboxylate transporter substrate binding protein [Piscinibacter sp. XHJ-5]